MGNWDACFLEGMPEVHDEIGLRLVETAEWWASFLSDGDKDFIRSFAKTLEVPLDDGASMFCFHGSPISYDDWIFAATPEEDARHACSTGSKRPSSSAATRICR